MFDRVTTSTVPSLWLFMATTFLASLTPGPNVFMTISFALSRGVGAAVQAILGMMLGIGVYGAAALLGLLAILTASRPVFTLIRIAGAAYLIFLGLRMLMSARRSRAANTPRINVRTHPFVQGLSTQISNPKSLLYWTALLPQFLDPSRPAGPQILLLGAVGTVIDFCVLTGYATLVAVTRRALDGPRVSRVVEAVAGASFATAGIWLLSTAID
jgi:homoserine/homoserine lactone efflux protein